MLTGIGENNYELTKKAEFHFENRLFLCISLGELYQAIRSIFSNSI